MNTCFKLFVICLFLFTLSCKKDIESKITITGNSKELINNTIYLKEYNHFNYLNKSYILDSTMVDSLGDFQFSIKADSPELITISKYSLPPLSYQVFKETPNIYYYSFCANFFANEPCLYIDTKKNYSITHWDTKNQDSSIIFNNENQNLLRNYYRTIDYRGLVTDENRQPLNIAATEAWDIILEEKEKRIKDYNLKNTSPINSFENYLITEISLGAVNDFLIWTNLQENKDIDPEFYNSILEIYNSEEWSKNSVEYYKLTERYITHQLNLAKDKNKNYYEPTNEKLEFAKKYAKANIKDKYLQNLQEILKQHP